ncbi:MAG TPA: sulfatase [Pirellulales bacterium]|nr:sulfatase [Pirellulales bacterium]
MQRFFWAPTVVFASLTLSLAAAEGKRPNILFCFADDWGRHAGAYAKIDGPGTCNDAIVTPHFDRLASEGVLFRRAFVSAPSCTPCRSALLSGQHFWRTGRGAILVGAVWDGSNPSFPLMLRDAGYHIGKMYKVWGPGTPGDAPYGEQQYAYEKHGRRFNQFSQHATALVDQGKSVDAAKQELYDEVLGNFNDFLAARKPDQPFCFWFGATNVHRTITKGSGNKLWGVAPDLLKGKMPRFLPDVPEVREDLADYFGEIQAYDAGIGLLIRRLEEIGELENTLIVASGDHGGPGFPHGKCNLYDFGVGVSLAIRGAGTRPGRVIDDLVLLPDLAPTFLELGGVQPPEVMTGRSLMPLLSSDRSGQIDPSRDAVFVGRERHVEDARDDYLPYPQRAIRTHDFLYIINFHPERWPMGGPQGLDSSDPPSAEEIDRNTRVTYSDMDASPTKTWLIEHRNDPQWKPYFEMAFGKRPREELYVLKEDRDEVNNVAADPRYGQVRASLEQRLLDELRRTGDPRMVDDGKFFETPPMAGPVVGAKGTKKQRPRK